jgi:hypothetical protein
MSIAEIAVLAGTVVALAGLGWFFFGPRRASTAPIEDGVSGSRYPFVADTAQTRSGFGKASRSS